MNKVSHSQYSMWKSCPYRWKLNYIDKVSVFNENINFLFGKAMHTVLQHYLVTMYTKSIVEADKINLRDMLLEEMKKIYTESKKNPEFQEYSSKKEMIEFYSDGCRILEFFKKNRGSYFSKKGYSIIGVEVPLNVKILSNLNFVGYLDVVIKDDYSGEIKIFDFKTSSMGWRGSTKKDETKLSQLILYKKYFSEQYDVPLDKIKVYFLVLKRKLFEYSEFTQKRFQKIEPASGKVTVKKVTENFNEFLKECFDKDGNKLADKKFRKLPSTKNCKYCEFNNNEDLCDRKP